MNIKLKQNRFLPVQTLSLVGAHAADSYDPDGHVKEQATQIVNMIIKC